MQWNKIKKVRFNSFLLYINIYIYIYIFGPVKPELGVIPSGQEGIQAWIFDIQKWSEEVLLLFSCFWKPQKCVTGLK